MKARTGFTGCDAIRSGYGGEVGDRMNPSLRTIAQTFRAAGYQTGLFGKWHNGRSGSNSTWCPTPMKAGFDSFAGFYGGGTDFFTQMPKGRTPRNWHENDRQSDAEPGYTTDLISVKAIEFIEQNATKPFFCMVAHAAPHEPFQATDALLLRVPESIRGDILLTEKIVKERTAEFAISGRMDEKTREYGGFTEAERRVVYSAMMIGLDDSVGAILDALKKFGQDQNTIVLLFSDNGAMRLIREGNLPLRGTKHSLYDRKQDPSESEDVSAKFPKVTATLRAKHDGWLEKHGANFNYTPPAVKTSHEGRSHGQALDIRWAAPKNSGKAQLAIPLKTPARMKAKQLTAENQVCTPGDCLVYDMKIESMQPGQTAYISPLRGEPIFEGANGSGVDAGGFRIASKEMLPGPLKEWKRYVLGLGNSAASNLSDLRLVVENRNHAKGDVHLLLDNVHILKPDGQVIPVRDEGDAPSGESALTCTAIEVTPVSP